MKRTGMLIGALALIIGAQLTHFTGALAAPNIDHYAALPGAELAEISPDGRVIAMVQGAGGDNRMIAFYPLDGSKPSRVDIGPMKARDLTWVSDDRVILWASITAEYLRSGYTFEFSRVMSVSQSTGDVTWLFSRDPRFGLNIGAPRLVHTLPDDPKHILMSFWDPYSGKGTAVTGNRLGHERVGDEWWLNVYEVEIDTGKVDVAEEGNKYTSYYVADAQGNIRIRSDYVDGYDRREIHYRAPGEKKFSLIDEFPDEDGEESAYIVSWFNQAGDTAYAFARGLTGRWQVHEYDLSGKLGPVVWSDPVYDVRHLALDAHSRAVVGVGAVRDFREEFYFDQELAGLQKALKSALKLYDSVELESWSRNRNMFVVRAQRAGAPSELYLFDRKKKELSFLASNYPNIPAEALGQVERYDYRASDGLDIPGYLYTPNGKPKKNLPLVVLPHGGPWSRDSAEFDWEAQYYAALGYAVYKPNFRGSDGYGVQFRDAGFREWGGKMQDDITEGVQKLIADGVVDPSRICIVGGSYGGYAALMGGAKWPDLYKCVVSYAGVTDIPGLFRYDETYGGISSENVVFMRKSIGNMREDPAALRAISPVNLAENYRAPVLLIHGRDDTVVPIDQSRDMRGALKRAGKTVEFVELKGEDHWLSTASTRTEMLRVSGAFLQKHLGR